MLVLICTSVLSLDLFHGFPLYFLFLVCVVCVSLNKIVKTVDVSCAYTFVGLLLFVVLINCFVLID